MANGQSTQGTSGLTGDTTERLARSLDGVDNTLKSINRSKAWRGFCAFLALSGTAYAVLAPNDAARQLNSIRTLVGNIIHHQSSAPLEDVRRAACEALKPGKIRVGAVFNVDGVNYRIKSYGEDNAGSFVGVGPDSSPSLPTSAADDIPIHAVRSCPENRHG